MVTLGQLLREGRIANHFSVEAAAKIIDVVPDHLRKAEAGDLPLSVNSLRSAASLYKLDFDQVLKAAVEHHREIWSHGEKSRLQFDSFRMMNPESDGDLCFIAYREGWIAGASLRSSPGDLGEFWELGYRDGNEARESAFAKFLMPARKAEGLEDA